MDNVFIERLWRSLKYEEIYLREYRTLVELEPGLQRWFERYNAWRPHQALGNRTPAQVHAQNGGAANHRSFQKPHENTPCRGRFWFFHSGSETLFRYAPKRLLPSVPESKSGPFILNHCSSNSLTLT